MHVVRKLMVCVEAALIKPPVYIGHAPARAIVALQQLSLSLCLFFSGRNVVYNGAD